MRFLAGETPFAVASDLVAMELGDATLSLPSFVNAQGNGANGWRTLDYADLHRAFRNGLEMQDAFSRINTDDPDLSAFAAGGGRMLMYHGLNDFLIPPQGSINYYERVVERMGGLETVQGFYRMYLVPGMGHAFVNGSANAEAPLPLPDPDAFYRKLTDWADKGEAPGRYDVGFSGTDPVRGFPLCLCPQMAHHEAGDPRLASSFGCR